MAAQEGRRVAAAAANGDLSGLKSLIIQGEDVNCRSRDGMTPLAIAAFWGYADVVEFLLENGADVNLSNKGTNWTPLHCAAFQGHGKVIMNLLQSTPDLYIKDSNGRTAVDFASALDSVWSFFAAAGCKRTSKSNLIRMDIVKRCTENNSMATSPQQAYFSRPGSAYILKEQGSSPHPTRNYMMAASMDGDVLAGLPEENVVQNVHKPNLSLLRN